MLPPDGDVSLERIINAMYMMHKFPGLSDIAVVRTIVAKLKNEQWANLETHLLVGDPTYKDIVEYDAGNVRFISEVFKASDIYEKEDLCEVLTAWQNKVGEHPVTAFKEGRVRRLRSRNAFFSYPAWHIEMLVEREHYEYRESIKHQDRPKGPLLDPNTKFYAEDLEDAATQWFKQDYDNFNHRNEDIYTIAIADNRAYFESFELDGNILTVHVSSHDNLHLQCCGKSSYYRQEDKHYFEPIVDGQAQIELASDVKSLHLRLMTSEREWLDEYREDEHWRGWGSVVFPERQIRDSSVVGLEQARDSGETEQIEFKDFIPVKGAKSEDIVIAAVSFSNSSGGTLYIGVDDHAVVKGISTKLQQMYKDEYHGDLDQMKDAYIRDLRKRIAEFMNPSVFPEFSWINQGNVDVLRVHFPQGQNKPYEVTQDHSFYIRKGATNRKASLTELKAMMSTGYNL